GDMIENIIVPSTDGIRGLQVTANLKKAVETDGREVFSLFEYPEHLATVGLHRFLQVSSNLQSANTISKRHDDIFDHIPTLLIYLLQYRQSLSRYCFLFSGIKLRNLCKHTIRQFSNRRFGKLLVLDLSIQ